MTTPQQNRQARAAMKARLRTESELEQLIIDHFSEVRQLIPTGVDRLSIENRLLEVVGANAILRALLGPRHHLARLAPALRLLALILPGVVALWFVLGPLGAADPPSLRLNFDHPPPRIGSLPAEPNVVGLPQWAPNPIPTKNSKLNRVVTVVVMRFSGEHGAKFSDQLFSTLLEQVQKSYKNVQIRNEISTVDSFDGTQSQIRAMGRKRGADLVVWGTVNCTTKQACIRARITVVSKDLGWPVGWIRLEPESRVAIDELGESALDMDKRVLGLASRAIGLALYTAKNYAEAAWHLQKACEGNEEDAMQARVPLMDCCMHLGMWKEAEAIAEELLVVGKRKDDRDMQVQGRLWLAKIPGASEQLASALPQLQAAASRATDP